MSTDGSAPAVRPAIRLVRFWIALLSRVAPTLAERQAANLFLTPRRHSRHTEAAPAASRPLVVDAAGHRLIGWSWGEGPVVLLVHGWSGRAVDMSPLAAAFVGAGYRAVAFDMPAHGGSPGRTTTLMEWMRVLPAVATECGDDIHAIVGHSLGAAGVVLALEAGLQARCAVLLAPAAGPAYFLERLQRFIGLPPERAAGTEPRLVARVGRELAFLDSARAAMSLSVPVLILHDPADREVPWAHAVAIAIGRRASATASPPRLFPRSTTAAWEHAAFRAASAANDSQNGAASIS